VFIDYVFHDHDMLIALMERWDLNSNIFHLPTGKIIVTLEDIYKITRLPIRGRLVNMVPILSLKQVEVWVTWLTGSDEVNHRKRGVFLMRHVPEDPPAQGDL